MAGSLLAGWLILPGRGLSAANGYVVPSLANGADLRAFGGSVLYLALIALLALGVTTAVRDSAAGIGLVLGLLYLFPIVSAVIPSQTWSRHLEQIAPMTAGLVHPGHVGRGGTAAHPVAGPRRPGALGRRRAAPRRDRPPPPRRLTRAEYGGSRHCRPGIARKCSPPCGQARTFENAGRPPPPSAAE